MSFRYPAGLITAGSPVTPEYPSGVWTNQQAAPYINGQVWANDPFFNQTVLLLHGDGTNGAQNNTFLDSSSNNFTITRNGNTTQGTFSPFSVPEGYWSNYFDGSGDSLSYTSSTTLNFGTADFTVEGWINIGSTPSKCIIRGSNSNSFGFRYGTSFTGPAGLGIFRQGLADLEYCSATFAVGVWYHVAVVRQSGVIYFYINGVQQTTQGSGGGAYNFGAEGSVVIGSNTSEDFLGSMSNIRVTKSAVYTGAFTPPTAPLTAITNTSLLTCQSNRFVDNSTNAFAITRNGDVRVTPFDPFLPTGAYSPSVTGGSGYFDNSGDSLQVLASTAMNFGADNFTVEFFVYHNSLADFDTYFDTRLTTRGIHCFVGSNGTFYYDVKDASDGLILRISTSSGVIRAASWNHIAICRSSGTTTIYVNGASAASAADSNTYTSPADRPYIGDQRTGSSVVDGYISNFRAVKGTAVYTSAFTPPTSPVTAISGTSLLLNFTNAGILDNTMSNNLETAGNVQVSTTLKKYGTGAMYFDGSGDFTVMPINKDIDFTSSGAITVEFWMYGESTARAFLIGSNAFNSSTSNYSAGIIVDWTPGVSCFIAAGRSSGYLNLGSGVTSNNWHHIAFVYNGATTTNYAFLNGTLIASSVSSSAMTQTGAMLFGVQGSDRILPYKGYIDDLRITKVARYTANFTPPIARFPNQ